MAFFGADVEALRAFATAMDRAAESLSRSAGTVDGALHRAAAWNGPWADRFRSRWTGVDRRGLVAASAELHDAARRLRSNADAQAEVSADRSSDGVGGSVSSGTRIRLPPSSLVTLGGLQKAAAAGLGLGLGLGERSVLDFVHTAAGVDPWRVLGAVQSATDRVGEIGKAGAHIDDVIRGVGGIADASGVVRNLGSGALSWDSAWGALQTIGHDVRLGGHEGAMSILDAALEKGARSDSSVVDELAALKSSSSVLHAIGKIGTGLSYGGAAISTAEFIGKAVNGQASATDLLSVVGTDLKTQPAGTPLWLTGVLSSIAATDAQLIQQTDLSPETFASTMDFVKSDPSSIGRGLVAGVKGVVGFIPGWFS